MKNLNTLNEALEDVGDVTNFQAPSKSEWEFVDKDHRYSDMLALNQASDMLTEGNTIILADFFLKIGEAMVTYNEASDLEIQIVNSVRELTQTLSKELMEGDGMVMIPSKNSEVIKSLKYMFKRFIEALEVHAQ